MSKNRLNPAFLSEIAASTIPGISLAVFESGFTAGNVGEFKRILKLCLSGTACFEALCSGFPKKRAGEAASLVNTPLKKLA